MVALGYNMNGSFHVEMASRTDTALDQFNHVIDATFPSVETFEPFDRYTKLQSLCISSTARWTDGSTEI